MQRISLAIQTPDVEPTVPVALLSGSLTEKLEKAARFGAQGIEFMTVRPKTLDAGAIRKQLESLGLEPAAVASGAMAFAEELTLLHPDALRASQARNRLVQLIEFAGEMGAPLVTIGSFRGRLSTMGPQSEEILGHILFQASQLASQHSVRLVIEPLNHYETDFISTASQGLEFIQKVGHSHLGLLLDTYHMNIEEQSWTKPFITSASAGKLWHVHLGDNNRLPPGQGLIDFRTIISVLDQCAYSGFLSAELLAKPNPDEAAHQTIQHILSLSRL
jgi:sugar phosphate isomerase/epimerase